MVYGCRRWIRLIRFVVGFSWFDSSLDSVGRSLVFLSSGQNFPGLYPAIVESWQADNVVNVF